MQDLERYEDLLAGLTWRIQIHTRADPILGIRQIHRTDILKQTESNANFVFFDENP